MSKIGVIDLGTNTFHLLIAEISNGKASVICNEKISVKIGQGGISQNVISSEASERAMKALNKIKVKLDEYGVKQVQAIGTSAIRNAKNGNEFIKEIKRKTGIEVKVISGDKEAELIYSGVKLAMDIGEVPSVIMDIGGGSVEFIICNQQGVLWKQSFEIGGQRLIDKFHKSDPISNPEIQGMVDYLEQKLSPLFEAVKEFKPSILVGSSGAFDTLCDIDTIDKKINFRIEEEKEYELSIADFEFICYDILSKNREERMQMPGMIEMRADMIVVACILIQYIIYKLKIQKIRVCSYALKEGVLSKILKGENIESDWSDWGLTK